MRFPLLALLLPSRRSREGAFGRNPAFTGFETLARFAILSVALLAPTLLAPSGLDAQPLGRGSGVRAPTGVRAIEVASGVDWVRQTLLGTGYVAELAYLSALTPASAYRIGLTLREGTDAEPCLLSGSSLPCREGGRVLEVAGIFVEPRRTVYGSAPDDRLRLEAGTRISIERLRNGWNQDGYGFAGLAGGRYTLSEGVTASITGQAGYLWFPSAVFTPGVKYSGFRGTLRAGLIVRIP